MKPYNILQILISSDYLVMKELKDTCIKYFSRNLYDIVKDAYCLHDNPNKTIVDVFQREVPFEQLEDYLFDELANAISADYMSIV